MSDITCLYFTLCCLIQIASDDDSMFCLQPTDVQQKCDLEARELVEINNTSEVFDSAILRLN